MPQKTRRKINTKVEESREIIIKTSRPSFASAIIIGLVSAGVFCAGFYALALFNPGQTKDPGCDPSDPNCTVVSTVPYTGASQAVDLGAQTITAGVGTFESLELTTNLAIGNGGTGLSSIPLGSVLVANTADVLSALTSTTGTTYLKNASGTMSWDTISEADTLTSILTRGNTTTLGITTTGAVRAETLKAAYSDTKFVTLSNNGSNAELNTDTEGDVYFFDGNNLGENYGVRVYGYITATAGPTYAELKLSDINDEFLINVADGDASTTLNAAIRLDDESGVSVFRVEDSTGAEVFNVDSNGNVNMTGLNSKLTTNGFIDPPGMLFDPMTRSSIKTMTTESIPENKRLGVLMFYNQESGQMELYMPWNDTFQTLGGAAVTGSGTVGDGTVQGVASGAGFVESLKVGLASLGVSIKDGASGLKNLIADTITTKKVRMESMEMVDRETGDVYCLWLANGEWKKSKGDCSLSTTAAAEIGQGASPESAMDVDKIKQITQQAIDEATKKVAQDAATQTTSQIDEKVQDEVQQQLEVRTLNITSIAPVSDISVANGTEKGAIGLPGNINITLSDGASFDVAVTWDNGTPPYDPLTAGSYAFLGTLALPNNASNGNNFQPSVNVIVAPKAEAEVTAFYRAWPMSGLASAKDAVMWLLATVLGFFKWIFGGIFY